MSTPVRSAFDIRQSTLPSRVDHPPQSGRAMGVMGRAGDLAGAGQLELAAADLGKHPRSAVRDHP